MRRWALVVAFLFSAGRIEAQERFHIDVLASARGISADAPPSWITGGFGRLSHGSDGSGSDIEALGNLELGVEWNFTKRYSAHVSLLGRVEPDESRGEAAGLNEAYLQASFGEGSGRRLRARAGTLIFPTSRENVDALWSSPYTLTLSAINSWIAEEVRPTGLDVDYRWMLGNQRLTVGAIGFGGNDSMGALVSWRGWSMGGRKSVYEEVVPLPPLFSLGGDGIFAAQRRDGTKPFGEDLDGRAGWGGRVRWESGDRFIMQASRMENRGDRGLREGEYAWDTSFNILGGDLRLTRNLTVAAEYLDGSAKMGPSPPPADVDFNAYYVLSSWSNGRWRGTVRYDRFETNDIDGSIGENNDERGHGWTGALFREWNEKVRLGVEVVSVEGDRPAAAQSGADADLSGSTWTLEARYRFAH